MSPSLCSLICRPEGGEGRSRGETGGWIDGGGSKGGVRLDFHLIVVRWELMEQLFDAVFLPWAVHVGHLVLRQGAVVLMNLGETERRRRRGMKNDNIPVNMYTSSTT